MARKKEGHGDTGSTAARRKTASTHRKKATSTKTGDETQRTDRPAKVAAKSKKSRPKEGSDSRKLRLTPKQRETLAQIKRSSPDGFVVEGKRLYPTITSLLNHGLIMRTGRSSPKDPYRYHLTKSGLQVLAIAPTARAPRADGGRSGVKSPKRTPRMKTVSRGAARSAAAGLAAPPYTPSERDHVEIIKSGETWNGMTGFVTGFTTKDGVQMAIVSYEISNGEMGSRPFAFGRLKKIP
jgi:hypothetical protein